MSNISPSGNQIQIESVQYQAPVSESSLTAMGSSINYCLTKLVPVGTIVASNLSQAQFNAEVGAGLWLLCNAQSCVGTYYASVTGNTTVPNCQAQFATVTPWTGFTAGGNITGNRAYTGTYRRVGDSAEIKCRLTTNGTISSASLIQFYMPSGLTINTSKMLDTGNYESVGRGVMRMPFSVGGFPVVYTVNVSYYNTTTVAVYYQETELYDAARLVPLDSGFLTFYGGSPAPSLNVEFKVPISGWGTTDQNYFIRVN